ncbi:MAG: hypothetical protein C4551_01005 [Bacillota bacterium]|nr:MAG: hypothetical protein C4551_01005 [Bacillota bacterium]
MSRRATELLERIESDTGATYALASARSEAFMRAADMLASSGELDEAAHARLQGLVFAFRETESFDTGGYFGPRYSRSDGSPYPDFYSLPPHTQQYLKARAAETTNPLHKARYSDFLWDKFRDREAGQAAVKAYVDCARLAAGRGDGNSAFRAMRRACVLARQFRVPELLFPTRDAALALIDRMCNSSTTMYVPRVAEALMGLAETLTPEQRGKLVKDLEKAMMTFVKAREYHLVRWLLKSLRQLYKLSGDEEAERRALLAEGESYETEGDYKARLDGAGGGPEVAGNLYHLALTHFLNMGETARAESVRRKMNEAHKKGPANFQAFIETLRRSFSSGGSSSSTSGNR